MAVPLLARADERAVGAVDALTHADDAAAVALHGAGHVLEERVHVEHALGHVDQVRARALVMTREGGGGGEPARVASHDHVDLHAGQAAVVHVVALVGERHEARSRAEARAVVGLHQVVVHGLGHVDDLQLLAASASRVEQEERRLRRVVAPDVEQEANVVGVEGLDDALGLLGGRLLAHGAQGRTRRRRDPVELRRILLGEVDEVALEDALHAVQGAVHAADARIRDGRLEDADEALVDDGRGATGLSDEGVAEGAGHGADAWRMDEGAVPFGILDGGRCATLLPEGRGILGAGPSGPLAEGAFSG